MERTWLRNDEMRAMLLEDEDESGGSDGSYIPSDDDGEVNMILSDPESDYDSSSNGEDVVGLPADAATPKARDGKESRSIAPITSSQGRTGAKNVVCENSGPTRHASRLCSSASDCFFLSF